MQFQILDALMLATGFTGALTLVWLARVVWLRFVPARITAVHFSPHGGCTEVIVREIATARREVLLLAYGFTSRPVAQALVEAKLRGIHVEVILDHSNETDPHTEMGHLLEQGLSPLIDSHHSIAHNKVVIIDRATVVTGSFNFTQHAETHNAENLLVLHHHHDLAAAYCKEFATHREHSRAVGQATSALPEVNPIHDANHGTSRHATSHHEPHSRDHLQPHAVAHHAPHPALEPNFVQEEVWSSAHPPEDVLPPVRAEKPAPMHKHFPALADPEPVSVYHPFPPPGINEEATESFPLPAYEKTEPDLTRAHPTAKITEVEPVVAPVESPAPRFTAAAADVFARLRKQMAEAADDQAKAA